MCYFLLSFPITVLLPNDSVTKFLTLVQVSLVFIHGILNKLVKYVIDETKQVMLGLKFANNKRLGHTTSLLSTQLFHPINY